MDGSEQALVDIKKRVTDTRRPPQFALDLLGYTIIDAALNAIKGSGETNMLAPNQLAKVDDMAALDKLIAVYK